MRIPCMVLLGLALLGSPVGAQESDDSSPGGQIRGKSSFRQGSAAYSRRNEIMKRWEEKRTRRKRRSESAGETAARKSEFRIPQGQLETRKRAKWEKGPEVFEKFVPGSRKKAEKPGKTAGPAPRPVPPPRPRAKPSGLRGVRVRSVEDVGAARLNMLRNQRQTRARSALKALSSKGKPVSEFRMVQQVLQAMGADVPASAAGLPRTGFSVPRDVLEPGDLVFFDFRKGARTSKHVGVYYGGGRFAYATSKGVKLGDLSEDRWVRSWSGARRVD